MTKVRDEITERETLFQELAQGRGTFGRQQMIWKTKSGACKQRKKGVQWMLLRLCYGAALHLGSGARKASDPSPARGVQQKVRSSNHSSACGVKRRRRRGRRGASTKGSQSPNGSTSALWAQTKAFWLVLFMILLGTRMQTVRAVEEEISIRLPAQTAATDAGG